MKQFKKIIASALVASALAVSPAVHASGIPVVDGAAIAQNADNFIQQMVEMGNQLTTMKNQLDQAKQQYQSLNGIRNMGDLVNNQAARSYLPANYQAMLQNGVGQWKALRDAFRSYDASARGFNPNSNSAKGFEGWAKQTAIARASAEEAYKAASKRFSDIQVLMNKINAAPDAKDIADLQARIQAEQVMMQNETNKLMMLSQLHQTQRDIRAQQVLESQMGITKGKGRVPTTW